ncbi:MAG: hypothetical protein PXX77_08815 [Gallionella sp.]|nr:hypothetical protein [Gallionella sp.]
MTNQRTVAFLDILGFRQMVMNTPLSELVEKYERQIANAESMRHPLFEKSEVPMLFSEHPAHTPLCEQYIFSDSIILVSTDNQAISALKLLIHAWRLSQAFIAYKMPLRGGIAFGELYSNPLRHICVGKALTVAYELEKIQAWIGVSIDQSVEDAFPELFLADVTKAGLMDDLFLRYKVPMKDGTSKVHRTLNWRFNLIVEKGTRSLFVNSDATDVRQKVANTLDYAETVVRSGRVYVADQSKLPVELRSMWIGGKEPPFKHGDDL